MRKLCREVAFLCCGIVCASRWSAAGVLPANYAEEFASKFQIVCLMDPPNAEHLATLAAALRMKVVSDTAMTTRDGAATRSRIWAGELKNGPYELRAEQVTGPNSVVTTCGFVGEPADAVRFHSDVVSMMHLPSEPVRTAPGVLIWTTLNAAWATSGTSITLRETASRDSSRTRMELSVRDERPRSDRR